MKNFTPTAPKPSEQMLRLLKEIAHSFPVSKGGEMKVLQKFN